MTASSFVLRFLYSSMLALLLPVNSFAAPFAYVTNLFSNTVSVIDVATDTVVATINVGVQPGGVAIAPDGTKAYVTNYQSFSVSVIDVATNTVSATIPLGERPVGVAITPDGTKTYVVGTDTGGAPGSGTNHIFVINTATNTVSGPFPSGGNPNPPITSDSHFIAITPDGSRAYVTNRFSQTVSIIDTATNLVAGPAISIAGTPISLAITPDGKKVYVGNDRGSESAPGIVWVIDTSTNTVTETISTTVPGDAFDLAKRVPGVVITPNGAQAWVTLHEAGKIGAISVATDQLITTLGPIDPLLPCVDGNRPGCANGIAITPDGSKAYVTMGGSSNKVAVFNLTINMLASTITVGSTPSGIAITPLPLLRCIGFDPPMDNGAVKVKKNRVLPLKAALFDTNNNSVTDVTLSAPPVIQVFFDSGTEPAVDVTNQVLPAGQGTEGNQFEFSDGKWRFNLQTKNYTAPGTYVLTMNSGDESSYRVAPTCEAVFVIEE